MTADAKEIKLDDLYLKDENGNILPVLFNIYITLRLHPDWINVLSANFEDDGKVFIIKEKDPPLLGSYEGAWGDFDNEMTAIWMQHYLKIFVTPGQVAQAARAAGVVNSQTAVPATVEDILESLI